MVERDLASVGGMVLTEDGWLKGQYRSGSVWVAGEGSI